MKCGTPLPMGSSNAKGPADSGGSCSACGSGVRTGDIFCPSCGARIGASAVSAKPRGQLERLALFGGTVLLLLFVILGGFAVYRAWRQSQDLAAYYASGSAALQTGDYQTALQELGWVVQHSPDYQDAQAQLESAQAEADSATLYSQAQAYCDQQEWDQAISVLERLQASAPDYQADAVRGLLSTAYRNLGLDLVQRDQFAQAVQRFDQSLALTPDVEVEKQKQLAILYPQGLAALDQGQYASAIQVLSEVYAVDPKYRDVAGKLYAAYLADCTALRDSGNLEGAETRCVAAYQLDPTGSEAAVQLTQVAFLRTPTITPTSTPLPPTPTATPTATPAATNTPRPQVCRDPVKNSIAFKRQNRCDKVSGAGCGAVDIWVMNADGSNQKPICDHKDYDWALLRDRTSNDGTWRVEVSSQKPDIIRVYTDGRWEWIIVNNRKDWDPVLSADNWWLAWVSNRNANDEIFIKTFDPGDQNQRRLTVNAWEWDKHPTWSPDGHKLAFYSNRGDKLSEATRQIWVMEVVNDQGVSFKNLSNNPDKVDTDPVWIKWDVP